MIIQYRLGDAHSVFSQPFAIFLKRGYARILPFSLGAHS